MLLILDIDETLIHATNQKLEREPEFRVFHYYVYERPYLKEFLKFCNEHFRIAIWSSASDNFVSEVVKIIIPPEIELEFVWSRNKCTYSLNVSRDEDGYYNLDGLSHYSFTKQFKKLRKKGYDLSRVLMIDDTPEKLANSYGNAIYVREYTGGEEDNELKLLTNYLLKLKNEENVRTIEKRFWRNEI